MNASMTIDEALAQATTHWSQGDKARANELALLALRADPEHAGALNMAGCAAFDAGNTGVALALFQKAVQAAPQDHSMQGNLARNEFVLGRVEPAPGRAMPSKYTRCAGPRMSTRRICAAAGPSSA